MTDLDKNTDLKRQLAEEKTQVARLIDGMKKLRRDWLEDYAPSDGTECVTPFDEYLYSALS